jgi:fructuronate reductase
MSEAPRLVRTRDIPAGGVVHFGPGAFFRAFIAPYTDETMVASGGDWGITAISLKSRTALDQLVPQGCQYTVVERGADGDQARQIGAIRDILLAPERQLDVIAALADPATRVVTLTVTEKGYCHDPLTGRLQADHPDIRHDVGNLDAPRTVIGFLVAGLQSRREAGQPPFTVLSCDNLPANGTMLRGIVTEFAVLIDPRLAAWIEAEVSFPCCMVDRITPATTKSDLDRIAAAEGQLDLAAVVHEPFRQWVIEDDFPSGRPDWAVAGAQFVSDVERHELMKLRCLNGTHSTLAYLGYLAGHETISDAVAEPAFSALCRRLWRDEILPTLPAPEGEDLPAYCESLLDRYRNPAIRHRTWQIAMDGSQKLPQRLLGTISDRLAAGTVPQGLCLAVAGWMRYVAGTDEAGDPIDVRDPIAERLKAAANSADPVTSLLAIGSVFDRSLAGDDAFVASVRAAHARLRDEGSAAAVAAFIAE